jgi:hypothetical protein
LLVPSAVCRLLLLTAASAVLVCTQIVMGTFIISFIGNSFVVNTIDSQVGLWGTAW